ncbi:hypothetical protein WJ16_03200 [Burkholderia metallica]|nr:hypothetical protein WJ16_03200 [Burkholderia metallica]
MRKARQTLHAQRERAKFDPSTSAALLQREAGTLADWQLRQTVNALGGHATSTANQTPRRVVARRVCY